MAERLPEAEIRRALEGLKGWSYAEGCLQKKLNFASFSEAFAYMTRCAFEIEKLNHHPEWSNVYSRLEIRLRTHEAGGVTELDLELARKMDELLSAFRLRQ